MEHKTGTKAMSWLLSLALVLGLFPALAGTAKADTHTHSFTYAASGATITAECSAADCPLENSQISLSLAPPENLVYNSKFYSMSYQKLKYSFTIP